MLDICDTIFSFLNITDDDVYRQANPILKRDTANPTPDICPKEVDATMDADHPYDPPGYGTYKDLSGRKAAIEAYIKREQVSEYTDTTPSCAFFQCRVMHYDLLNSEPPKPLRFETVRLTNPLEPFAARALDRLISQQEKKKPMTLDTILSNELDRFHAVVTDEKKTIEDLRAFVCEQTQDLLERCEARLEHLPSTLQIDPRKEMKKATGPWTQDDEDEYHEKLLTRIPDALTQRFMNCRTNSRVVGLDANDRTLRILRDEILPAVRG